VIQQPQDKIAAIIAETYRREHGRRAAENGFFKELRGMQRMARC